MRSIVAMTSNVRVINLFLFFLFTLLWFTSENSEKYLNEVKTIFPFPLINCLYLYFLYLFLSFLNNMFNDWEAWKPTIKRVFEHYTTHPSNKYKAFQLTTSWLHCFIFWNRFTSVKQTMCQYMFVSILLFRLLFDSIAGKIKYNIIYIYKLRDL